jgi:argininosuccinate lyase
VTTAPPDGYLGASSRIVAGPAPELVAAGYALETADAPLLHRGLTLADLAHVVALVESGVVPAGTAAPLLRELLQLVDTAAEDFPYDPVWGDAYNSRERELERRLGATAGWLHTGRTRREAGRIAFRLALLDLLAEAQEAAAGFVEALLDRAAEHARTLWDDSTYLQPAQPSTFGHYLLSFAEQGVRDLERLAAAERWVDRSPAGVGGVGGTLVPLDRERLARLLGFAEVGAHTRDAMWSVDGLADVVVAAAQLATTVDRLAEDLEIWTSPPFGWVELDASLCRASVQMPQKRNPYALAVVRGGANTLLGRAAGALATGRTPSARTDNWLHGYGETAGALVLARRIADLGRVTVATLRVDVARLARTAGEQFTCATDVTEALVLGGGLDYRSAYRIVGAAVAAALADGRTRFGAPDLAGISAAAAGAGAHVPPERLAAASDPGRAMAARTCRGGSAPERVLERCAQLRPELDRHRAQVARRRVTRARAGDELIATARLIVAERSG